MDGRAGANPERDIQQRRRTRMHQILSARQIDESSTETPAIVPRERLHRPPGGGDGRAQSRRWETSVYGWLLVIILSLPVVIPTLTRPIEDRSIDPSLYHIYRSIFFSNAVDQGWPYPRWADTLNGGLGSPVFNYYSPVAYYATHALHMLGLPHALAWRVLMAMTALVAALGAYQLALAISSIGSLSVFAATAYLYAPAFLSDLWQRGSPQVLVTALLPVALLAMLRLAQRPGGTNLARTAALLALLLLSHNLGALLSVAIIVPFGLYLCVRYGMRSLPGLALAAVMAVLLSSIHLGPFIYERPYVQLTRASDWEWAKPEDQRLGIADLGLLPPVYDSGIPNLNNMNAAQIDLYQIVIIVPCAFCLGLRRGVREHFTRHLAATSLITAIVVILLQLDVTTPLWRADSLDILQFRWRLLALLAPSMLVLLSTCSRMLCVPLGWKVSGVACLALVVLSAPRTYPQLLPVLHVVQDRASPQEITQIAYDNGAYDLSTGEFQPVWRTWGYSEEEMKWAGLTPIANLPEGAQWLTDERTPRSRTTRFSSPVAFDASLHLLYFPGWQVTVDGEPAVPYPSEGGGYLTVPVPAGEHEIVAYYGGTPVQHVSAAVSALAALACAVLAVVWRPSSNKAADEPFVYERPRWEVAAVLAALVAAKLLWIDPHTTWFRHASTRDAIYGATEHLHVTFDDQITLHGYRIDRWTLEPGDEMEVTLYWSADGFPDGPLPFSFVHLLGSELNPSRGDYLWGQSDASHRPARWEEEKLFADEHALTVDPGAPSGEYSLEIGWWWPETGKIFMARVDEGSPTISVAEPGYLLLKGLQVSPEGKP